MPEQIRCPSCNATLRVPDTLLGKNVKCPKCQTTFTAAADAPVEPDENIVSTPAPAARRRPAPPPEEPEDEGPPPEEYEDEERPRRRKRGRRSEMAASAVAGPAISLMVVGGIDIAIAVFNFLSPVLGFSLMAMGQGGGKGAAADLGANAVLAIGQGVFNLVFGVLIILGALKMKQLQGRALAMTACIMAMIPCVNCCILGLPFGIWGVVVLNKPEVKDAFS